MWEGWTRVSSGLTPVSVTLSWMWGQQLSSGDSAVPDLLIRHTLQICRVYFDHDGWDASLPNNYSKVASTHHSPRGYKSQSHHPGMASSHRPPTCPWLLLDFFLFSAPLLLLSQILTSEYFRPQSQTLRSTLPSRDSELLKWETLNKARGEKQEWPNDADDTQRRKANGNRSSENDCKAYLQDTRPLQQGPVSSASLCSSHITLKTTLRLVPHQIHIPEHFCSPIFASIRCYLKWNFGISDKESEIISEFQSLKSTVSPLTQTPHLLVCRSEDWSRRLAGHLFSADISAAFARSKPPAYLHSRGCTGTTRMRSTHWWTLGNTERC